MRDVGIEQKQKGVRIRRTEIVLGLLAVFLVGAVVGILMSRGSLPGFDRSPTRKVEEALDLIRDRYVEQLSSEQLAQAAIEGMVGTLDPYTTYIDARVIGPVQDELEGEFGGVGIWFEMVSDSARVVSIIPGGPSESAGVRAGDRIVAVDDSSCVGEHSLSIQRRIRGSVGEPVRLTIFRPLLHREFEVSIERAVIPIRSVEAAFRLDDNTAYVRMSRFTTGTGEEFSKAVSELLVEGALDGLLIDVRDNPGGILEAAVAVSDEILADGSQIVRTQGRRTDESERYVATGGGALESTPVILLVNQNSASASEILAGAVQDNDRGLVVGRPTFGKGLVQRQFMFTDGSALHLTVARYYTPSGRPIQNDLDRAVPTHFGAGAESPTNRPRPDTLSPFTTVHGREVLGGRGIHPDHLTPGDSLMSVFDLVFRSGLDLDFSRSWFDQHEAALRKEWTGRSEDFLRDFSMTDEMWRSFLHRAEDQAGELMDRYTRSDVTGARAEIGTLIKARIAQSLFGPYMWFSIIVDVDPEIAFARRFWQAARKLPGAPAAAATAAR